MERMTEEQVREFIAGRRVFAFDPDTQRLFATVDYGPGGRCRATFAAGGTEAGEYGISGATYWTRYESFRDGEANAFELRPIAPGVVQAYHLDGRRAFIQSHRSEIEPP